MNLGTQTGSLINHIYSNSVIGQPEPFVGMGATLLSWSDRSAGTIVRVFKIGKSTAVEVQEDDAQRIDNNGLSESQEYVFTSNPNAYKETYKMLSNGRWVKMYRNPETNRWIQGTGGLCIGSREKYYDFSF